LRRRSLETMLVKMAMSSSASWSSHARASPLMPQPSRSSSNHRWVSSASWSRPSRPRVQHGSASESLEPRIHPPPAIPTAQYLHRVGCSLDTVEHLEVLPHHEAPDLAPLPYSGKALGEEGEALTCADDVGSESACSGRIMRRDGSDDLLKVCQERVLEDYLELHCSRRARTSSPELPCPGATSALATASSRAARSNGSSSSHAGGMCRPPSFSTKTRQDLSARRRSSSGVKASNWLSISASFIARQQATDAGLGFRQRRDAIASAGSVPAIGQSGRAREGKAGGPGYQFLVLSYQGGRKKTSSQLLVVSYQGGAVGGASVRRQPEGRCLLRVRLPATLQVQHLSVDVSGLSVEAAAGGEGKH